MKLPAIYIFLISIIAVISSKPFNFPHEKLYKHDCLQRLTDKNFTQVVLDKNNCIFVFSYHPSQTSSQFVEQYGDDFYDVIQHFCEDPSHQKVNEKGGKIIISTYTANDPSSPIPNR